jgi:hypothetical protein
MYIIYHGFDPRVYHEEWLNYEADVDRMLGVYRKTKVPCSCWMCGNPRRYNHELPRWEQKALLEFSAQMEEVGLGTIPVRIKNYL